jgi:hypothetical protein
MVNAGISVCGLVTVAAGVSVMVEKGGFEWINACGAIVGLGMLSAAAIAFNLKGNAPLLRHHVVCSAVIMALEVVFACSTLVKDRYSGSEVVRYVPVISSALLFVSVLTGWCYLQHIQPDKDIRSPLTSSA